MVCRLCQRELPESAFYAGKKRCKECICKWMAAKYEENREAIRRQRNSSFTPEQRERARQYSREYYAANRECLRLQQKEWDAQHVEYNRERRQRWTAAHPGYSTTRGRLRRKLVPEVYKACELRRVQRERGAQGTASAQQIAWRVAYWGNRCWMCDGPFEALDHVKPLAAGGTNWPANLRPACLKCNRTKNAQWPFPLMRSSPTNPVQSSRLSMPAPQSIAYS